MHVEPHWHLEKDENLGTSETEIIAYQKDGDDLIPLILIQGGESVWLSREQAETLRNFINQEVLGEPS
jgi:hypothetical protein